MNIGGFLLIAILVGVVGIPILAVYSLREWAAIGSATFPEWQARVESQRTIYGLCRQLIRSAFAYLNSPSSNAHRLLSCDPK